MEVERITGTVVATPTRPTVTAEDLAGQWLAGYSSPNTRAAYGRDFRTWLGWLAGYGVDPLAVRRSVVDAYARALEAAGAKPTTVARNLATLSSFYGWCTTEGHLEANPAGNVRRPKTGPDYVKLTPALTTDELGRLIAAATDPRDRALVLLLAVLGLRVSEALSLNLEDVRNDRGHRVVTIVGKGGTRHDMPLPPLVVDALEQVAAAEGRTTGPVFVSTDTRNGHTTTGRTTRHGAARVLARLTRAAGLATDDRPQVRPHTMRATAITCALEAKVPLREVQDLARHKDPRTTRRYDRAAHGFDNHAAYALARVVAGATPAAE